MSWLGGLRFATGALLVGYLALACGGKSADPGAAGLQASGGSSVGVPSKGGAAGGSNATGGSNADPAGAVGGTGREPGRGGSPPAASACTGASTVDNIGCAANILNWTHDEQTGVCKPIVYGGCGATANNYTSLADCQAACSGHDPDYDACEQASDCMVQPRQCCGCAAQTFIAHDLVAFNRAYLNELDTCAGRDVACTPCPDEPNGAQKPFVPACIAGECAVADLREHELTACEVDSDCKLRLGSECCTACGEGTNLIAVRSDGSFEQYVCGDEPPGCPECEGTIPSNFTAVCDARRCQIHELGK